VRRRGRWWLRPAIWSCWRRNAFDTRDTVVQHQWSAQDSSWKVPDLDKLIVYELHVEEFNATFDGVVERLPYLRCLGVTCLELLPVTSLQLDFDWGYGPLHYFAPNELWGGAPGLKRLVDACHAVGVAVILDVVYQHVAETFPYFQVYQDIRPYRLVESPMINGRGDFGPRIDYARPFALEYVRTVNRHWLEEFHVDGFRYDEAGDLADPDHNNWDPLATITRDTYSTSLRLPRFTPSGGQQPREYSRLIQVAEYLRGPAVLQNTYASATWQDDTLGRAEDATRAGRLSFPNDDFAHALDASFSGYR
jgi:1,4-alpha-glucan branching enzyme